MLKKKTTKKAKCSHCGKLMSVGRHGRNSHFLCDGCIERTAARIKRFREVMIKVLRSQGCIL